MQHNGRFKSQQADKETAENGELRDERGRWVVGNPGGPGRKKGQLDRINGFVKMVLEERGPDFLSHVFAVALSELRTIPLEWAEEVQNRESFTREDIIRALHYNPTYPVTKIAAAFMLKAMPGIKGISMDLSIRDQVIQRHLDRPPADVIAEAKEFLEGLEGW